MEIRKRLDSSVFDLPIQELRRGYRSDIYFWREKRTLEIHNRHPTALMQVFQKNSAVLCGIDEALAVLKVGSGRYREYSRAVKLFDEFIAVKEQARRTYGSHRDNWLESQHRRTEIAEELDSLWEDGYSSLEVKALRDGDEISPRETVLTIKGDITLFAHLETLYLGVLARRTRIATNVRRVVEAAGNTPILYFPARFDHWAVQGGDGYAAHVGGVFGVSTRAQAEWWGAGASGTVPHALIAAVGGDTVEATRLFGQAYPDTNLVSLVDFDNDCVNTALACARELGDKLWGVRLDTSETMVDKALHDELGDYKPTGVVPELVFRVREALDREGFEHVKIVVSGGFDPDKIAQFRKLNVPVDSYGVGSALMGGNYDFTADVVEVDGLPMSKAGRRIRPNDRLETV